MDAADIVVAALGRGCLLKSVAGRSGVLTTVAALS